jgi:hypothetical protein
MSDNDSEIFLETDKTTSVVGKYTPQQIKMPNSSQYPYNNICYLEIDFDNGEKMAGCASLIGERILATCAHNVLEYFDGIKTIAKKIGKSAAKQMKIIPQGGFSDVQQTLILETGKNCFYPNTWDKVIGNSPNYFNDTSEGDSKFMNYLSNSRKYDFAFLVLDNPFDKTKFNEFFRIAPFDTIEKCGCCCTYINSKGERNFIDSNTDDSNCVRDLELQDEPKNLVKEPFLDNTTVEHLFDTGQGGASGCPLYTWDSQDHCTIIAIHSLGNQQTRRNFARKVDKNVLRVLDFAKNAL